MKKVFDFITNFVMLVSFIVSITWFSKLPWEIGKILGYEVPGIIFVAMTILYSAIFVNFTKIYKIEKRDEN